MNAALDMELVERVVANALEEDRARDDVTTGALIAPGTVFRGKVVAREPLVVAGLDVARVAMTLRGPNVRFESVAADGARIGPGESLAVVEGPACEVLPAERTALNFLGRLCGVATLTAEFVERIGGTGATLVDTRKTTPGLRALEKYAVRVAGGANHRPDLAAMALIKDNHLAAAGLSPLDAAKVAREKLGADVTIELEVDDIDAARAALEAPVDILMLDNFPPGTVAEVVAERNRASRRRPVIEVSGGVTIENIRAFALSGADRIAVGAVIHSARFMDVGLDEDAG